MIIVTDKSAEDAEPILLDGQPVSIRDIADFECEDQDILVFDIDLGNRRTVAQLGDRLGRMQLPPVVACAVDPFSYRARAEAYLLGATNFLPRPFASDDLEVIVRQTADLAAAPETALKSVEQASDLLQRSFAAVNAESNLKVEDVLVCGDEILDSISTDGMHTWLSVVRARHEGTFQHCLIVTGLVTNFARHWGMSRADVDNFSAIGLLHDIGKVRIPNELLDKPGKLTAEEYEIIKTHPVVGYDYLLGQSGITAQMLDAVRHHHEMLDGSGYPDGLSGSDISDFTRILTICDIYGAMVEHRTYKKQALPEEAMAVLVEMADDNKLERSLVRAFAKTVEVTLH